MKENELKQPMIGDIIKDIEKRFETLKNGGNENEVEEEENDENNNENGEEKEKYGCYEITHSRNYQVELLERAKERNTIVFLRTGSGKTFIAVMLIKEISQNNPDKICIMLEPVVPLVEQHYRVLSKHISSRKIGKLTGDSGTDDWRENEWNDFFGSHHVVVMTPAILVLALSKGFFSLKKCSLLVFDEAHHTLKNHPYNQILKSFYFPLVSVDKPKILGLTASPLFNPSTDCKLQLVEFQKRLDSHLDTASDPEEVLKYTTDPHLQKIKFQSEGNGPLQQREDEYVSRLLATSYWSSKGERDIKDMVKDMVRAAVHIALQLGTASLENFLASLKLDDWEVRNLVNLIQQTFKRQVTVTDKAEKLVRCLCSFLLQEDFRCIVFVERKRMCDALKWMIENFNSFPGKENSLDLTRIKCGVLVGHDYKSYRKGMSTSQQVSALEDFASGVTNILIATSVAEEGIDVQPAQCVIHYDQIKTLKQYVQSRGRARHVNARFFLLTDGSTQQSGWIRQEEEIEVIAKADIAEKMGGYWEQLRREDDCDQKELLTTSKGALLQPQWSISLLYNYCQTLSREPYTPVPRPNWTLQRENGSFQYQCTMPNSAPFRLVEGPISGSKKEAKRQAAYKACKQLYEKEVLDENLCFSKSWTKQQNVGDSGVTNSRFISITSPSIFPKDRNGQYLLFPVTLSHEKTLEKQCHWSASEIQMGVLFPLTEISLEAPFSHRLHYPNTPCLATISGPISVCLTKEEQDIAMKYHITLFAPFVGKEKETKATSSEKFFSVVPLGEKGIDWNSISTLLCKKGHPLPEVMDPIDTVVSTTDPKTGKKKLLRIIEDSDQNRDQHSLFFGVNVGKCRNLLNERRGKSNTWKYLVDSSECRVEPFSMEVLIIAMEMRTVLYEIERRYAGEMMLKALDLASCVPLKEILRALTVANVSEDNLERYEFLGDCFLKYAVSLDLFFKWPHADEGRLTREKIWKVSNNFLWKLSTKLKIAEYMIWKPLNIHWSVWPFSRHQERVKEKAIADCVEALIGVTFKCGGEQAAFDLLRKFEVIEPLSEEMFSLTRLEEKEILCDRCIIKPLEECLDYPFSNKWLALQAITHPSKSGSPLRIASYQRLEFLGDAILDLLITIQLFQKQPELSPGDLTIQRSLAVCNQMLSRAIVSLDLQKSLQHDDLSLFRKVSEVSEVPRNRSPWDDNYPKSFADMFEALTAAVFLDSGKNLQKSWDCMRPLLEKHIAHADSCEHPISIFHNSYSRCTSRKLRCSFDGGGFKCTVLVNNVKIALAVGETKSQAKAHACKRANDLSKNDLVDKLSCLNMKKNESDS